MFKKIIAITLTAALVLSFTACQKAEPVTPLSVAIVLGAHANSMALNLSNVELTNSVSNSISSYGLVSVVCNDGKPNLISADINTIPEQYKNGSAVKLQQDAKRKTAVFLSNLTDIKADDPETDTLEALRLAVRSLVSAPEGSLKKIVVIDTGISTTGMVDFNNNLFGANPEDIAAKLSQKDAIPDFTGITVLWHQLGDVSDPQQSITPEQRNKLIQIWKTIIETGGGIFESSDIVSNGTPISDGYPQVTAIDFPKDSPISFDTTQPTTFSEEQVRFIPDTAEYTDAETVKTTLEPIADYIKENPDFKGLLVGSTANTGDDKACRELSLARANAVHDTFIQLGVPANQLATIGLGYCDPWHLDDRDSSGNFVEDIATQNRKVVLIDADSAMAQSISK